MSLCDGLVGLGWLLEYCYHRKLISFDTNRTLHDMDDLFYKRVMSLLGSDGFRSEETFHLLLYYHRRTKNGRYHHHVHRNHSILPCLRLLIYRTDQYLLSTNIEQTVGDVYISLILLKYACIAKDLQVGNFNAILADHLAGYCQYLENKASISYHDSLSFFIRAISLRSFINPVLGDAYSLLFHNKIKKNDFLNWRDEERAMVGILEKTYLFDKSPELTPTCHVKNLSPLAVTVLLCLLDIAH